MNRLGLGLALMFFLAAGSVAAPSTGSVEVRFCPASTVRSYPLDTARDVRSLLLQNVALINRSSNPVTISEVEIALQSGGRTLETRRLTADMLAKSAKAGAGIEAAGMLKLVAFQFCGTELLAGATLSGSTTLAPGAALLVLSQPFAYGSVRDQLTVTAFEASNGTRPAGSGVIKIDDRVAATQTVFPLQGAWWVVVGAGFHTPHRWAIPEEFGIDIVRMDINGKTYRGSGQKFSDFHAYGQKIIAPAAGKIVLAINNEQEDPKTLRQPGESSDAFFERVLAGQGERLERGTAAILGNGVVIDHGNGEFSVLAHMKPGSVKVAVGDVVKQGQEIGALGSSGNSSEPHLHYHMCNSADGLLCAGIPLNFTNVDLPLSDFPRPLQSGDMVIAR